MIPSATSERRAPKREVISPEGIATARLVVLCQAAHFLTYAAMPLLLPLIRTDLAIGFTQAGMLSAAATLSYALGQIPAGYLSDRFGPRRLFLAGLAGWSVLSLAFGLVRDFHLALVIQFVAGVFRALLFAPGLALLASWFPAQRRATAMSLYLLGGAAGSVLLSLIAPYLVVQHGWRSTFMLFAAIGVGAACAFAAYAKDSPSPSQARPLTLADLVRVTRLPLLWVCCWLQFVRFAVTTGFTFWLPSFLVAERGFSLTAAGLVMAFSAALAAPANTAGAYVSDRLHNPPLVIGGALAVLACAAALLPAIDSVPVLLAVIAVYSIFYGFYFGPLFLVPVEVLGTRVAGTSIGFSNLFANLGAFVCVYALGVVKDLSGSFALGFLGISGLGVVGVALSIVLARMRVRALRAEAARAAPTGRE